MVDRRPMYPWTPVLCRRGVQYVISPGDECLFFTLNQDGSNHLNLLAAGTALGGFVLALLVVAFPSMGLYPAAQMARCSMGFVVSVVWIMAISDEVVNLLQVTDSDARSVDAHSLISLFFRHLVSYLGFRMPSLASPSLPSVIRSPISSPTRASPYVSLYPPIRSLTLPPLHLGLCPHDGLLCLLWRPDGQHPPGDRHLRHVRDQPIRWRALRSALYPNADHEHGRVVDTARDDAGGGTDEGVRAFAAVGFLSGLCIRGVDECEFGGGVEFLKVFEGWVSMLTWGVTADRWPLML